MQVAAVVLTGEDDRIELADEPEIAEGALLGFCCRPVQLTAPATLPTG
jgi:hypothetical protein